MNISISGLNSSHEYPILMAVSILSPVNTHILIPAFLINSIVSAKSSYNLSSIAVDPIKSNSTSNYSAIAAIFSSLSYTEAQTIEYFLFH